MQLCYFAPLSAQPEPDLEWAYFGPEQGLGMSFLDLIQDHKGFIWMASSNGLYRYDGYKIQSYKVYSNRTTGLSSDWIWDLEEDQAGNIWMATYNGGISMWERATDRFHHYRHEPGNPNSLSSDQTLRIMLDRQGKVWAVVRDQTGIPVLDRLDPATGQVRRYRHQAGDPASLSCDTIPVVAHQALQFHPLYLAPNGEVWVATQHGLNRYLPETDSFERFLPKAGNPQRLSYGLVLAIEASRLQEGTYWVRTATPGLDTIALDRLDAKTGRTSRVRFGHGKGSPLGLHLLPDETQAWIADVSLQRYSLGNGPVKLGSDITPKSAPGAPPARLGVFAHSSGSLLLVPKGDSPLISSRAAHYYNSNSGFFFFSLQSEQLTHISHNPLDERQIIRKVNCILEDRSGLVWIGTSNGVYKLNIPDVKSSSKPIFETYLPGDDNGLRSIEIRDAWEESPTVFWLATFGGGLSRLDRSARRALTFTHRSSAPNSIGADQVYALWYNSATHQLWIGHDRGIDLLDLGRFDSSRPETARFERLREPSGLLEGRVNSFLPDGKGRLWIGTQQHGLILFDPVARKVLTKVVFDETNPDPAHSTFINKAFIASDGQLWAAPGMGGLVRILPKANGFDHKRYLDGLYIVDFLERPDGQLWCAALNYGLLKFDPATETHDLISMENRLTRNSITSLETDALGRVWFTSAGLTRYDPLTDTYRTYGREAGVIGLDPVRSLFRSSAGELFYNSLNGALQIFTPENVVDNPTRPKLAFTDFKLFNESVKPGDNSTLRVSIELAEAIYLRHSQHSFSLEFASMEFTQPQENQYRYQLVGLDEGIIFADTYREARYSSVPPGRYTFRVQASNNDGVWMEDWASIDIFIAAPWWKRTWAYFLYGLALLLGIGTLYLYQRRRWQLQAALEMERFEAERLKELDAAKARLYANITHEFRTPLTVIDGMIDQIRAKPDQWLHAGARMVKRNTAHLLQLVNQMLDMQKLEAGMMHANLVQGDVAKYLAYLAESFDSLARTKSISLNFQAEQPTIIMDYDPDLLQHIISNLLSNAIKFNTEGGAVYLGVAQAEAAGQEHLLITVTDTGRGIPADKLPHIFERFYQVDDSATRTSEGTGIGLALTLELVKLLGGTIQAESELGKGSTFSVSLPIRREAPLAESIPLPDRAIPSAPAPWPPAEDRSAPAAETAADESEERPTLLIVEDNVELAQYLQASLEGDYRLSFAFDGAEGIEKALAEVPSLIISDVMMPRKNGFELCAALKNDERTSHIPIVLLTAKVDAESRLQGLRRGADAYLGKPFNLAELRLQLRNLDQMQAKLRARYQSLAPPPPTEEPLFQLEDEFLAKAHQAVLDHLDDPEFTVTEFCKALAVSRTQLHNKLKALTGHSATSFQRTLRLQHAQNLLRATNLTVSEVAYEVGFNDPNYFSRCYREAYGLPPTEERGGRQG